jgi:hypothetical protein
MTRAQIENMQRRIGAVPDGFWGPKSMAACQKHLRAMMPHPNPWPKPDQKSLLAFYGAPGDESQLKVLDVSRYGLKYEGKPVTALRCHKKVHASLNRILLELSRSPFGYVLEEYAGVFANRPMRGGSLPSLHARGAAIDLRPGTNGLNTHWPTKADLPLEVMEIFAKEGWLPAGAFWSRDAMHMQATQ